MPTIVVRVTPYRFDLSKIVRVTFKITSFVQFIFVHGIVRVAALVYQLIIYIVVVGGVVFSGDQNGLLSFRLKFFYHYKVCFVNNQICLPMFDRFYHLRVRQILNRKIHLKKLVCRIIRFRRIDFPIYLDGKKKKCELIFY